MKALTIHQPWAWAIVEGIKLVENRTWATNFRGDILIHSGKSLKSLKQFPILPDGTKVPEGLVFGCVIGKATVIDCVKIDDIEPKKRCSFSFGPYCWILRNPVKFDKPKFANGMLGLFDVSGF